MIGVGEGELGVEIVDVEIDEELFSPEVLVQSNLLFTHNSSIEKRSLSYLVENKESIEREFLINFKKIVPSVMSALFSLDSDPYRLYTSNNAPLSAKKGDNEKIVGKLLVTKDNTNQVNSLILVDREDDEFIYLRPLWAKEGFVEYMKLEQGPTHKISFLLPFNLDEIGIGVMFELFSYRGAITADFGVKGSYSFSDSATSIIIQGGFNGILPMSLFFSPSNSYKWYTHLSLIAQSKIGFGMHLNQKVQFMFQSTTSLLIQYFFNSSFAFSMGGALNHTVIMKAEDASAVDSENTHYKIVMQFSLLW